MRPFPLRCVAVGILVAFVCGCGGGGDSGESAGVVTIDGPSQRQVGWAAGVEPLTGSVWVPSGSTCDDVDGTASLGSHRFQWRNHSSGEEGAIELVWNCRTHPGEVPWAARVPLVEGSNHIVVEMDDGRRHGEAAVEVTWKPVVKPFPPP
jgi:hypothetical protein